MNFTLNQLNIYCKVVEAKSITKAAEELHLTQPAVSIQLKNFQEQFDIPLIEVLNKKLYVTDFGYEIAAAAQKILDEVHAINFKMHAHSGQITGKLKLSSVSTGKYIAPYILADFINNNLGVELVLDVTNKNQVIHSLEKNEIDFALVSVMPDNPIVEGIELMENKLYLVGKHSLNPDFDKFFSSTQTQQHQLKSHGHSHSSNTYSKEIFENLPLIYRENGSGTRHVMEKFLITHGITSIKKMELTSNEAVKQAVLAGLGYSIMPIIGIKNELENRQLQIIHADGFPISSRWTLIWLKNKRLSPVSQAFLDYLVSHKNEIIEQNFGWISKLYQM
jgi:LysR family transcriptional regulator, low CO2-responsive transcriptional regulator